MSPPQLPPSRPLQLTLNGKPFGPVDVPESMMMLDVLQELAGLTGTRLGCGIGACSACAVIVDRPDGTSTTMRTCITGAHYFEGKKVRTVESHAQRNDKGEITALSPVQQKFLDHFSFQCGYCTPGFVNAATVLVERLRKTPVAKSRVEAEISRALQPHICRCTGYVRYAEAIKDLVVSTPGLTTEG